MTTSTPTPEPPDEDVVHGLAKLEQHANVAPRKPITWGDLVRPRLADAEPEEDADPDADEDEPAEPEPYEAPLALPSGDTRRVQRLAGEVAEARLLLDLQAAPEPLMVDTAKVRKRRLAAHEAARLHALSQDPTALAYRDARVRRLTTVMALLAACVGLAISSIGVQASVVEALDLLPGTLAWWAAYGVEPALSMPLLAAVAVQAYSAMRGRVVDRKSPEGRRLFRTEALLLGLTLVLNCWPAVAGGFDPLALIVHSLGPVAAVVAVWVLPVLWSVLADLPVPAATERATGGATGRKYRENSTGSTPPAVRSAEDHRARLRALIDGGELPPEPSATAIRRALGCGTETATRLRDELAGGA